MTASPHVRQVPARTGTLLVIALVLALGVVALPELAATAVSRRSGLTLDALPARVSAGFDHWAASGTAQPGPTLSEPVHFWRVFHVVKALLSALLLAPLVVIHARAKSARRQAHSRRSRVAYTASESAALLAIALGVVLVIANIQGAVAPLSSVLSFLPTGAPTSGMDAIRTQLTQGDPSPAATTLVSDFRAYHAAVAVCSALVCGALLCGMAVTWNRRRRYSPEDRSVFRITLIRAESALIALMLIAGLVTAANVSTVTETTPALVSFLGGDA